MNLGQLIGQLLLQLDTTAIPPAKACGVAPAAGQPKRAGAPLGRTQRAILACLRRPGTWTSGALARALRMDIVNVCCALESMARQGIATRAGARGSFTYTPGPNAPAPEEEEHP